MSNGSLFGGFVAVASNSMLRETHFGANLQRWNCRGQISQAHQIVGCAGEGKDPIHFTDPAMAHFPHQRNRLQPAKAFFDPLPLLLADGVSRCRVVRPSIALPPVRRRFCATCGVTRRVAALGHKPARVKPFVATHRHRLRSRDLLQHHQGRVSFRRSVGLETLPPPRSVRCGSPPTGSRCNSAWTPCRHFCAPAEPQDRSSMHASRSTSARRESSRWDCPDRPAASCFPSFG